ncbi:MAG: hypothetical protein J6C97_00955, partial [Clostridia bacterium]|nr:hypothetical protein [Clostridia bacterium]
MRKFLIILLSFLMVLSLSACVSTRPLDSSSSSISKSSSNTSSIKESLVDSSLEDSFTSQKSSSSSKQTSSSKSSSSSKQSSSSKSSSSSKQSSSSKSSSSSKQSSSSKSSSSSKQSSSSKSSSSSVTTSSSSQITNYEQDNAYVKFASWDVLSTGQLQVTIEDNGNAGEYILWEKVVGSNVYTKIGQSIYPTIIVDKFTSTSEYAVSVISFVNQIESEKYILTSGYQVNNILVGKVFVPTAEALDSVYSENYGYANLTDGINYNEFSGRYSSTVGSGIMDATINLKGNYLLDEIRFYDFRQSLQYAGCDLEISVLNNGEWVQVVNCATNSSISSYRVMGDGDTAWIAFNLNGVMANKIRISSSAPVSGKSISFYEIECSGVFECEYEGFEENVLTNKQFIPSADAENKVYNATTHGYPTLTDGVIWQENTGRFSSSNKGMLDGTIDLKGEYLLSEFKIYLYKNDLTKAGSSITIETWYNGEWTKLYEVANSDFARYVVDNPNDTYGYLLFNMDDIRAEKVRLYIPSCASSGWITFYEVECSGVKVGTCGEYSEDVLVGKTFVGATGADPYSESTGYDKLTDNVLYQEGVGRFSNKKNGVVDGMVNLGGIYRLNQLKIYLHTGAIANAGNRLIIQTIYKGAKTTIIDINNAEMSNYLVTNTDGNTGKDWLIFDMDNVLAEQIRVYIPTTTSSGWVTFYEIDCSGTLIQTNENVEENVLQGATSSTNATQGICKPLTEVFGGKTFIPTSTALNNVLTETWWKGSGYEGLTDGITNADNAIGRFSTVLKSTGMIDASINLGGVYEIYDLRFYLYDKDNSATILNTIGKNLIIKAYYKGSWVDIVACENNASIATYLVTTSGNYNDYLQFTFDGVLAERIRVVISGSQTASGTTFEEFKCFAYKTYQDITLEEVFKNKTFIPTSTALNNVLSATWWKGSGYEGLTDGIRNVDNAVGRFATIMSESGMVDATLNFDGIYELYDLKFYLYDKDNASTISTTFGKDLLVQVYYNGVWLNVVNCADSVAIAKYLISANGNYNDYLQFNLNGILAERVRIYISGSQTSNGTSFEEITCTGFKVTDITNSQNVLSAKTFTPTEQALASVLSASWWKGSGYEGLTDGITNADNAVGRFSTIMNLTGMVDATVELGDIYDLYDLKFHLYDTGANDVLSTVGANLLIQTYYNGAWTDVVNCADNATIGNYLVTNNGSYNDYLLFNLNVTKAEKIRVYISASQTGSGTSFEEITCSGYLVTQTSNASNVLTNALSLKAGGILDNMLDGDTSTYAKIVGQNGSYYVQFDFDLPKALKTLRIYEVSLPENLINGKLSSASDNTIVEIYKDGYWLTVASNISLTVDGYTVIDLKGIKCTKIRITFNNRRAFDGETDIRSAVISEIDCTACYQPSKLQMLTLLKQAGLDGIANYGYIADLNYQKFKGYAANKYATLEEIASYTQEIQNYVSSLSKYKVVWKNYDQTTLETDSGVIGGTNAQYNGKTPTKPDSNGNAYIFAGWATSANGTPIAIKDLPIITKDTTFYAIFTTKKIVQTSLGYIDASTTLSEEEQAEVDEILFENTINHKVSATTPYAVSTADPSVICCEEDGYYYMYGTYDTPNAGPYEYGIICFRSTNLTDWEPIGANYTTTTTKKGFAF